MKISIFFECNNIEDVINVIGDYIIDEHERVLCKICGKYVQTYYEVGYDYRITNQDVYESHVEKDLCMLMIEYINKRCLTIKYNNTIFTWYDISSKCWNTQNIFGTLKMMNERRKKIQKIFSNNAMLIPNVINNLCKHMM